MTTRYRRLSLLLVLTSILLASSSAASPVTESPSPLFLRGYSVIPSPRHVRLQGGDVALGPNWSYQAKVPAGHIAVRSLLADLKEFHALTLGQASATNGNLVVLSVAPGSVNAGTNQEIARQAYRISISPNRVEVVGNADEGLFYGVQTLLQLLKPDRQGQLLLPLGTIEDWPKLQLRFLHWDTKHHQSRIETLKRYLDWSARFKVNMIGFELEDKFEYPSHPVIGAPGAFTTAQLQELVHYGLERFIQIVPQVQSPAHMNYVLKHPEFADLRSDGNNYQSCMCDERTYNLLFSMYDDLIRATPGVKYFHVSTDEVYYAGICAKCSLPYNDENRSLTWIDFAKRAHDFLAERGRRMLAWVEYPVLPEHIKLLPPDLINAVMSGNQKQTGEELAHGMEQLIYTSMQGEELLFPDNLSIEAGGTLQPGRLNTTFRDIRTMAGLGRPIGVYGAAWDDSGLHSETFWLGWSAVAQAGWNPESPSTEQHVTEFAEVFYGPNSHGIVDIYRAMQSQARFFDDSWDSVVSRVRGPAYGNSQGKGIGATRYDRTLPPPPVPSLPDLSVAPQYTAGRYSELAGRASRMAVENDRLAEMLYANLHRSVRNGYNLEVFLSIAKLCRHQERLISGMKAIEEALLRAHGAAADKNSEEALELLMNAQRIGQEICSERVRVFEELKKTWEKSRFPKGRDVGDRKFYHVMDDTKDHWADRRPDLSYMIAPEESIGLDKWLDQMAKVIASYGK